MMARPSLMVAGITIEVAQRYERNEQVPGITPMGRARNRKGTLREKIKKVLTFMVRTPVRKHS